jgi:hypothetical protein
VYSYEYGLALTTVLGMFIFFGGLFIWIPRGKSKFNKTTYRMYVEKLQIRIFVKTIK